MTTEALEIDATENELLAQSALRDIDDMAHRIASLFENDDPVTAVMVLRKAAVLIEAAAKQRR